ncbi:MAG: GNAT family N-acetyltransferase [Dehalococcoidia bacterium]
MSHVESRAYSEGTDLERLVEFAAVATTARWPSATYWHAGDVIWRLFSRPDASPTVNVRLWFDADDLVGVAFFEPPDHAEFDLHGVRPDIQDDVIGWAERRRIAIAQRGASDDQPVILETTALGSDFARLTALKRNGYTRVERHAVRLRRSLATSIPRVNLPRGLRLRHANDVDIDERVATHRDAWSVWGPSGVTRDAYRTLRAAPVYDQELDIVLEIADGTFASYCICWLDRVNLVGYFEPVGTRPNFAGQGFAHAVIYEGLRRLRDRGMHTALVQTASINERALSTYLSCGFEVAEREDFYEKRLS